MHLCDRIHSYLTKDERVLYKTLAGENAFKYIWDKQKATIFNIGNPNFFRDNMGNLRYSDPDRMIDYGSVNLQKQLLDRFVSGQPDIVRGTADFLFEETKTETFNKYLKDENFVKQLLDDIDNAVNINEIARDTVNIIDNQTQEGKYNITLSSNQTGEVSVFNSDESLVSTPIGGIYETFKNMIPFSWSADENARESTERLRNRREMGRPSDLIQYMGEKTISFRGNHPFLPWSSYLFYEAYDDSIKSIIKDIEYLINQNELRNMVYEDLQCSYMENIFPSAFMNEAKELDKFKIEEKKIDKEMEENKLKLVEEQGKDKPSVTKIQKYKTQLEKLQNDKNTIENNRSDFLKKRGDDIARVRVRLEKEGILDPWKNGWVYRFTGIPVGADAKIERHDHFTNYVLFYCFFLRSQNCCVHLFFSHSFSFLSSETKFEFF